MSSGTIQLGNLPNIHLKTCFIYIYLLPILEISVFKKMCLNMSDAVIIYSILTFKCSS